MSKRIVCDVCGCTVFSFASSADLDGQEVAEVVRAELRRHGFSDAALEAAAGRFKVVDENDEEAALQRELGDYATR